MGLCQSHPARRKDADRYGESGAYPFAKDRASRNTQSIKSTPGGAGKASYAYDLALISPSERTEVTDAISPTSIFSPDIANISPIKNESRFDFEIEVDHTENFSPRDGLEDLCSRIVKAPFPDLEQNVIRVEGKEGFGDESSHGLDSNDFMNLLAMKEEEFTEKEESREHVIYGRNTSPNSNSKTIANGFQFETNLSPGNSRHTYQKMMETPEQPIIQVNQEVNGNYVPPKLSTAVLDNFESYQTSSKFDSPPLLAPPKDVDVVAEPSSTYTAVNPSILANFNKMKTHVKDVQNEEKKRRQQEKIKDRRRDIEGYNELWGEYSEIQKRVIDEYSKIAQSPSTNKVSLADTRTWFVDFSALNSAENHLNTKRSVDDGGATKNDDMTAGDEDTNEQTNLPFLIQSSAFYSRHDTFGQDCVGQQKKLCANVVASQVIYPSPASDFQAPGSTSSVRNDYESDMIENDENRNISLTMDLDLGSRSTISDLGDGSNSSIASETYKAFDNDDYGVLRRYSRRSIESTVPTHTEKFNAKFGKPTQEDAVLSIMDPLSLKEKKRGSSFSKYLEKNCLPSVRIEDAETGLVRWRETPISSVELGDASNDEGNVSF